MDYEESKDDWFISNRPEGNQILYGDLAEWDTTPESTDPGFPQWNGEEAMLKSGLSFFTKGESRCAPVQVPHKDPLIRPGCALPDPEDIFTQETINAEGFQLVEVTLNTDSYRANQHTQAGYLMSELLWDGIRNGWVVFAWSNRRSGCQPSTLCLRAEGRTQDHGLAACHGAHLSGNRKYESPNGIQRTLTRPNFRGGVPLSPSA